MLSAGTRMGPYTIDSWVCEGACGQSYKGFQGGLSEKGNADFLKLVPREISEMEGFGELFSQECGAIEQLEGKGIWPLRSYGSAKWKHWLAYDWFEGDNHAPVTEGSLPSEESSANPVSIVKTLKDCFAEDAIDWNPDALLHLMRNLHLAVLKAHEMGIPHGNIKPSNILIEKTGGELQNAWITEFGLYRLITMNRQNNQGGNLDFHLSSNSQARDSEAESKAFRPKSGLWGEMAEESWDLFSLGMIAKKVLAHQSSDSDWSKWNEWVDKSISRDSFKNGIESISALPGVGDLTDFGIKNDLSTSHITGNSEELRLRKEKEWEFEQKETSLSFKRKMTGLIGILFLMGFLLKASYLFFFPSLWTEYFLEGATDRYQFGFGIWSGKVWGIVPSEYDSKGIGGSNVVGNWRKEDNLFKLSFRKFKGLDDTKEDKKLWQFIGKGATSEADYYHWEDYLGYDRENDHFVFLKRKDESTTYVPVVEKDEYPKLVPEKYFFQNKSRLQRAEILFDREIESTRSWGLFLAIGFLLAFSLYNRALKHLRIERTNFFNELQ